MITAPAFILGNRYELPGDRPVDASATALLDGYDALLRRPVSILVLPATESLADRLQQRRTAGRFSASGAGLVRILDVADDGHRSHLILPAEPGELLSDRLRRGSLSATTAAQIALAVLDAREQLREEGSPGADTIDPSTVILGEEPAARIVALPREGARAADDMAPVRALYTTMTGGDDRLLHVHTAAGLRTILHRLVQLHPDDLACLPGSPEPLTSHTTPGSRTATLADSLIPPPSASSTYRAATPAAPPAAFAVAARPRSAGYLIAALLAGLGVLLAGAIGVLATLHTDTLTIPLPPPKAPAAPPPSTFPALLAMITTDPTAAGADGPLLRDELRAVATSTGETRRTTALRVLTLASTGHLTLAYAHAATVATTPYTLLNTPTDLIADLGPDPTAGGPNAHFLLNCMLAFKGKPQPRQQNEASEILTKIHDWAGGGQIKPDLVDAAIRIVTPVAAGTKTFTDQDTGHNPGGTPTDQPT